MKAGAIEDYTYLWWDVRPHPNLGTVEIRVFDQQTRLDRTRSRWPRWRSPGAPLCDNFDAGEPLVEVPTELVDDNKVRAAMRGIEGELVDFGCGRRSRAEQMAARVLDELASTPRSSAASASWRGSRSSLAGDTGAHRQLAASYERDRRSRRRLVERADSRRARVPRAGRSRYPRRERAGAERRLPNCGSEVSPYVTECPYCGTRLRKRAPKLEREGDEIEVREGAARSGRRDAERRRARAARGARSRTLGATGRDRAPIAGGGGRASSSTARPTSRSPSSARSSGPSTASAGATSPRRSSSTTPATCSYRRSGSRSSCPPLERRIGRVPALLLASHAVRSGCSAADGLDAVLGDDFPIAAGANGIALGVLAA